MAQLGETTPVPPAGRPESSGQIGGLLLLALALLAAFAAVRFVDPQYTQAVTLSVLAFLAMAGVFFLFAAAMGLVALPRRGGTDDLARAVLDASPDALVAVDRGGRVLYANAAYAGLSGGAGLQSVERLFAGASDVSEAVYCLSQAARENRASHEEINLSPSLDGARESAWYRVGVRPLSRAAGRAVALWSLLDITEEREAQERAFGELQHAIDHLDQAPAGFLSVERDGTIGYLNATLASWLDYDLAQVGFAGLKIADLVDDAAAQRLIPASGEPGETRTEVIEVALRRRNGQPLPVRLHHRVSFGRDGLPGPSRTVVLDRSAAPETAEGERTGDPRFAGFLASTPIAIGTVDAAGRLVRANPAFAQLLPGVRPKQDSVLDAVVDVNRPALEQALRGAKAGQGNVAPIELQLAGEGGRSVRVWVGAAAEDAAGESAVLYALDTTDLRHVEAKLAEAQKMNAVGQLAGGVAHDFNNMLQAIIGYCDLLLAKHRPTDPSFQDLMQIKQNANRAAGLVRQLLAFSRRQTLRPQVLQLSDALSDLSVLLRRVLGERVELDLRHGRDLWFVKADMHHLEQAIVNLVVNARDAMPDGGKLFIRTGNVPAEEAAHLAVPGMPAADYVLIEVEDTGTGIAPEVMNKIFEPFFTTKEVGKGTGLGLSTVFGIVQQSGGFMKVDSAVGQGTTFRLYLPRHIPEPATEPVKAEPVRKPATDLTGQGTILLVEDEDPVRAVNARALSARGYTVLEAASGVEALQVMEERGEPVDLVVSDVVMPEMDGPTLLRELRKRYPDLKVIFVSGYAEEAFRKNLPEGEEFNFLAKPFSLRQLVELVKQVAAR